MRNATVWPSDLAMQALGIRPNEFLGADTPIWRAPPAPCGRCGRPIHAGEPYKYALARDTFSDTRDLSAPGNPICGACVILGLKPAMNRLSFSVLTKNGVYPIAKDTHKAWLFLSPPPPPFVAVISASTMAHLVWRTPVSLSKERFFLRYGNDLFTIRPEKITSAISCAKALKQRREEQQEPKRANAKGASVRLSPYLALDRDLANHNHGQLSSAALEHMKPAEKALFLSLTPGEVWALSFLLTTKPPIPEQPQPLSIDLKKGSD
ncbi:CRISPR type AFERR-associated protein Csf1 [Pseudomonas aeruginosa]|nr:type IV CRISPR-associated protein Csf1 [Pseudomonas aeruginosa]SUC99337.1 CRISPR type AFERR-associated protein Csf1 [Pseudomonas aeruginosa]VFT18717.1 CRISPR type AFERR-associated protein Csf1 [Pseudomonas aeruginosa]